jgi:hypothetical protein
MFARFLKWRVCQDPLSPTTMAIDAVLSEKDTALAIKSKLFQAPLELHHLIEYRAPSKTSTSSASAVEAVATAC